MTLSDNVQIQEESVELLFIIASRGSTPFPRGRDNLPQPGKDGGPQVEPSFEASRGGSSFTAKLRNESEFFSFFAVVIIDMLRSSTASSSP